MMRRWWLRTFFGVPVASRARKAGTSKRVVKPIVERLEPRLAPATHTWTGASSSFWSDSLNWTGGSPLGDSSADLVFPAGPTNLTSTDNDSASATPIHSITFHGSGYTLNAQGNQTLALHSTSGTGTINLLDDASSGNNDISLPVNIGNSNETVALSLATVTLTFSQQLSGGAQLTLSTTGNGSLFLDGNNTYSGHTRLLSGNLGVESNSALGSGMLVLDGGTLFCNTPVSIPNDVTVDGVVNVTAVPGMTQNPDLTFNGNIVLLTNSALDLGEGFGAGQYVFQFNSSIFGLGAFVVDGGSFSMTVVLAGANNNYSGMTTIGNGGTLEAAAAGAFSSNSAVGMISGATLNLNGFNEVVASLGGTGGNVLLGSGNTLTTGGDNTNSAFNGVISGNGNLIKVGTGAWLLSGINTYSGTTDIQGGILGVTINGALGTTSGGTTVEAGATLGFQGGITYSTAEPITLNGGTLTNLSGNNSFAGPITSLAASTLSSGQIGATLTLGGSINIMASILTVTMTGNLTINGTISGSGGVTIFQTGGFVQFAGLTYTGVTTILGGTYTFNSPFSLASSSEIDLENGASLVGTAAFPLIKVFGSNLAPGNPVGTMIAGSVTFNSSSTFTFNAQGPAANQTAQLDSNGFVNLNGCQLILAASYAVAPGDTFNPIFAAAGVQGTFQGLPDGAQFVVNGIPYQINYTLTFVTIQALAATTTHFQVSAPSTATAGSSLTFTVAALNANNNVVPGYTGTVHFTSSDGASILPANTTLTNGTGTFSATLKTAGSQTLRATDTITSFITGASSPIAVSAAGATQFGVSVPSTVVAGQAFTFTVTAQDTFHNTAASYSGTVHLTSSDATASLPANSTLTNGSGTFSAILGTLGNQVLTATDTAIGSLTGSSTSVQVSSTPSNSQFISPSNAPLPLSDSAGGVTGLMTSADGRFTVYTSTAPNVVPGQVDTAVASNVFLYDAQTATTTLVSHLPDLASITADGNSDIARLSGDGRYVLYRSTATDLVPGQSGLAETLNVFLYDRLTGTNTLISHAAGSTTMTGNYDSDTFFTTGFGFSANSGGFLLFSSLATDLVANQTGPVVENLFLYNTATGTTTLVSHSAAGALLGANGDAEDADLTPDGKFIVYESFATNVVAGQTGNLNNIFLFNTTTGATQLVSGVFSGSANSPSAAAGSSYLPFISANGAIISYVSNAANLVAGQTNSFVNEANIFSYHTQSGVTSLVSGAHGSASVTANNNSTESALSSDGSTIAFLSLATNLTTGQGGNSGNVFLYSTATGALTLASHVAGSSAAAGSVAVTITNTFADLSLSATGEFLSYHSSANNLVPGQPGPGNTSNMFVYDSHSQQNVLVSAASASAAGNQNSFYSRISVDGSTIAFLSLASNLASGLTLADGGQNLFLYAVPTQTGPTLVSRSAFPSDATSLVFGSSGDGRFALFTSNDPTVLPNQVDTNHDPDVFLFDRNTGVTTLVSHIPGSATTTGNAGSPGTLAGIALRRSGPVISDNGAFIAFVSAATNLVAGETGLGNNLFEEVFLYNCQTGVVTLVSHAPASPTVAGNADSDSPVISADDRYVAYRSVASNLITGGLGEPAGVLEPNVYLYDTVTGTTTLVSYSAGHSSQSGNAGSVEPVISADGRFVAYQSLATDLVAEDTILPNGNIFLFDRQSGANTLVSHTAAALTASSPANSLHPVVSTDGSTVAFVSFATNLVTGQINHTPNITNVFLYHVASGAITLASGLNGSLTTAADGFSDSPVLSGNGGVVAFRSDAPDLVSGQTNAPGSTSNVFLFSQSADTVTLLSHAAGSASTTAAGNSVRPAIDGAGDLIVYLSTAFDLVANQQGGGVNNVFLYAVATGVNVLLSGQVGSAVVPSSNPSFLPIISTDPVVFFNLLSGQGYASGSAANSLFQLTLSASTIPDGSLNGALVANMSVTDPSGQLDPRATYQLVAGTADNNSFAVATFPNGAGQLGALFPASYTIKKRYVVTIAVATPFGNESVSVTISVVPPPLLANGDNYTTSHGTTLTVPASGVLSNDSGIPPLTAILNTTTTNGSLTLNADGSLQYTPAGNFSGTDTFTYHIQDGNGQLSSVVTDSITVNPPLPVASADSYTTAFNTVLNVPVPGVLQNDTGTGIKAAVVTGPSHGQLTLFSNGSLSYTPSSNFAGTDTFSYDAQDVANQTSSTVTDTITVNPPALPMANVESYFTAFNTSLNVPAMGVLLNDTGAGVTAAVVTGPSHGQLTLNADGSLTYTPNTDFTGTDTFSYRDQDVLSRFSNTATDSITVSLPGVPVAAADSFSTAFNTVLHVAVPGVLQNDSGTGIKPVVVSGPASGQLTLNDDGSLTYTPNSTFSGTDTFSYQVEDGAGQFSNMVTDSITVAPGVGGISGVIFNDFNLNGVQDSGEPGLAKETVFLDLHNDGTLDAGDPSTVTDSNGSYSFSNVAVGSYTVRQVLYGGVLLTAPTSGSLAVTVVGGTTVNGQNLADVPTSITVPLTLPPTTPFPAHGSPNADFVEGVFRAVLNRNADSGGLVFWSTQLTNNTMTRVQVVDGIRNSVEHFGQEVDALYQTLLGRPSDPGGRLHWVGQLQAGVREEQIAFAFLDSPEYLSKGDKFFVDAMYQSLLGRAFDPGGETFWLGQLGDDSTGNPAHGATVTHEQVISAFLFSQESLARLTEGYYQVFLQRQADTGGLNGWVQLLQQGLPFLTIGEEFVASQEFYNRAAANG